MSNAKVSELISVYMKMKSALDAESKAFKDRTKDLKSKMEMIKSELGKIANELGVESLKSPEGTAFKAKKDFVSVTNWDEVLCFCIAPLFPDLPEDELIDMVGKSNLDYLSKGIMKTAVKSHLDEFDMTPPGCKYEVERVMNIRKT